VPESINFTKPAPLQDMVVAIDDVIDKKLDALLALESQMIEGCVFGHEGLVPKSAEQRTAREQEVRAALKKRFGAIADKYRSQLIEVYGQEKGGKVQFAEAFEVCEYGTQPSPAELKRLSPVAGGADRTR
jgi:N-acetylglucosamine malate deacetylase 1